MHTHTQIQTDAHTHTHTHKQMHAHTHIHTLSVIHTFQLFNKSNHTMKIRICPMNMIATVVEFALGFLLIQFQ